MVHFWGTRKMTKFGSARLSEKGTITGNPGDSTGREVAIENFYMASEGWLCFRPVSVEVAEAIKTAMIQACANNNIGYSQTGSGYAGRSGVITAVKKYGNMASISIKCNALSLQFITKYLSLFLSNI